MIKLPFQVPLDFYADSKIYRFDHVFDFGTETTDAEENIAIQTTVPSHIERIKEGTPEEIPGQYNHLLHQILTATINKYRVQHGFKPMLVAGYLDRLAAWHAKQRAEHKADLFDTLSKRPKHSANLGGVVFDFQETDLFLQQSLGMTEIIGHITEYKPQDDLMPDYTQFNNIWKEADLSNPLIYPAYAADIVATIAGTWAGKKFLLQEADEDLYLGTAVTNRDGEVAVDVFVASKKPTVV